MSKVLPKHLWRTLPNFPLASILQSSHINCWKLLETASCNLWGLPGVLSLPSLSTKSSKSSPRVFVAKFSPAQFPPYAGWNTPFQTALQTFYQYFSSSNVCCTCLPDSVPNETISSSRAGPTLVPNMYSLCECPKNELIPANRWPVRTNRWWYLKDCFVNAGRYFNNFLLFHNPKLPQKIPWFLCWKQLSHSISNCQQCETYLGGRSDRTTSHGALQNHWPGQQRPPQAGLKTVKQPPHTAGIRDPSGISLHLEAASPGVGTNRNKQPRITTPS